jgi:hypothetical protein
MILHARRLHYQIGHQEIVTHGANIEIKRRQRQDPYRELLFKGMRPFKNYNYDPEKAFYLNTYNYSYSKVIEKALGLASEIYDKLVKGLTNLTISTTAGLERYSTEYVI